MTVRIINADVMEGLKQLPDESVHCVVTSPPYFGLRDYGIDGQIGLEETPAEFVSKLTEVFREVRRVLRSDGTCWLNLGDSYMPENRGENAKPRKEYPAGMQAIHMHADLPTKKSQIVAMRDQGIKRKDLVGVPWSVAFALRADGWYLRSDIIWHKPNPMPESVTDRPTKSHEYVFLLAKSERYFYDADAIREPHEADRRDTWNGGNKNGEWKANGQSDARMGNNPSGRNKRSVWTIATAPFSEAHFATFPPELPELCIKAGTSAKGCCAKCGAPWERVQERNETQDNETILTDKAVGGVAGLAAGSSHERVRRLNGKDYQHVRGATIGWGHSCACDPPAAYAIPCTVLDPFSGAGTTCLVADRLQRHGIGIELNPEYAAMAQRRIDGDRGGLLDVMEAAQ